MNARTICLFAAALLVAPACIRVEHRYQDPYLHEAEPNNVYWEAQGIGPISVGEELQIRGHIDDFGADRYDGFAFQSGVPMDIEFSLDADDAFDDFDLELYDPYTNSTVARWESGANPETGRFSITSSGFEFHLVVSSFQGTGSYTLRVRGAPLSWPGDGEYGLVAQGISERGARTVDWSGYGPQAAALDSEPEPFAVQITRFAIDPETGRVRRLETRRVPIAALLDQEQQEHQERPPRPLLVLQEPAEEVRGAGVQVRP